MLLITIGVAFITTATALYLFDKQRRGIPLSKLEKAAIIIGIALDIVLIADTVSPKIAVLSTILGNVPLEVRWFIFGASAACFILPIVLKVREIRTKHAPPIKLTTSTTDLRFADLTIHYSQIKDTPDTQNPARPVYVTENRKKQAYWVSNLLEPYVIQHKIFSYSHDGEKALTAYLELEHYEIIRRAPLPEELGLSINQDGSVELAKVKTESDLVSKLKGRKLEDLQIVFLERKRFLSIANRRTLLLKISTKQAFLAPTCAPELLENGIVTSERLGMFRWESCKCWCKRHGYTLIERHYRESELTSGL
jgi:hypothetical protein